MKQLSLQHISSNYVILSCKEQYLIQLPRRGLSDEIVNWKQIFQYLMSVFCSIIFIWLKIYIILMAHQ